MLALMKLQVEEKNDLSAHKLRKNLKERSSMSSYNSYRYKKAKKRTCRIYKSLVDPTTFRNFYGSEIGFH